MENSDTDARLNLRELLKDEPLAEVDTWWRNLPPIYRARGRWVFDEPAELDQPRQRARRQLPPAGPNWVAPEAGCEDKHQKSSLFVKLEGESLAAWKAQCYRTTNQDFVKVCVPVTRKADEVWLRLMQKSHNSLLRPGAIDKLDHWQRRGCSQRQRDACSELLWSMQDHMTNKRGRSETKIKYGPKALPGKHGVVISDPFFSSLGRPSSAPIAHPVHRKFEAQKKAELEAQLEMARRTMEEKKRPQTAAPKGQNSNLKSTIPMRWPTAGGVPETSTQARAAARRAARPKGGSRARPARPTRVRRSAGPPSPGGFAC
jgi:hypothetical protein